MNSKFRLLTNSYIALKLNLTNSLVEILLGLQECLEIRFNWKIKERVMHFKN